MRPATQLLQLVGLAVVYVAAGILSLQLALVNVSTSAVWAPAGIAVAAFGLLGRRVWPAILVGAFIVNLVASGSPTASLLIGFGNTLAGMLGAALVARYAGNRRVFDRARTVFKYALLVGGLSTTVSATIGVTSLVLTGGAEWSSYPTVWFTWWLGDMGGVLVVAPLLVVWATRPRMMLRRRRVLEAAALVLLAVVIGEIVFGSTTPTAGRYLPLELLFMPVLIWAAFRFGQRGATLAVAVMYTVAVRGTLDELGPFVRLDRNESLLLLQGYTAVSSVTSLMLAALVTERRRSEERLAHLAVSDELTGLGNYRHLMATIDREIQRSERTGRIFTVLFMDMDGLKLINDQHGHLVGSAALSRLGDALRKACRSIDTAGRYGGDEFLVVLPETSAEAAEQVGRRVAEALTADGQDPPLSVSIGAAEFPRDGRSLSAIISAADKAQYVVKARKSPTLVRRPSGA